MGQKATDPIYGPEMLNTGSEPWGSLHAELDLGIVAQAHFYMLYPTWNPSDWGEVQL